MKYKHLTETERHVMSALKKQGVSVAKIAKAVGRHKSTIYREFSRNSQDNAYGPKSSYQVVYAQQCVRMKWHS